MYEIDKILQNIKNKKVLILGESILDRFIFCKFQGTSIKSFCPVVQVDATEKTDDQYGGAYAIYRHLKDFVLNLEIITNSIDEIIKTRYVDIDSGIKYFETNHFKLKNKLSNYNIDFTNYDLIILADFGHGFCDKLPQNIDNLYVMCQTNSSNYGFNRVSKWKSFKKNLVCIDKREASLQINKNYLNDNQNIFDLSEVYNYELNAEKLIVTFGSKGGALYDGSNHTYYKSVKTNIIDTIGSGDAFFAFISILDSLEIENSIKLKIANYAAALTTTWLANSKSITKDNLMKFISKYED